MRFPDIADGARVVLDGRRRPPRGLHVTPPTAPAAVVLVGAHGHGRWHLQNIERLSRAGVPVRLAGVCDTRPPSGDELGLVGDAPVAARLPDLLDAVRPGVTIVCTPLHTHAELTLAPRLARVARPAGEAADDDPRGLRAAGGRRCARAGVACQVGFQSLGSHALPHVRALMADGAIGEILGIGAAGAWQRDSCVLRPRPLGRAALPRRRAVVDGVLTNPFAHATATALALDGDSGEEGLREVRVELFHANPIEADDTSCLRLVTARGTTITVAATLCAEREAEPYLIVHGSRGRIILEYRTGRVRTEVDGRVENAEHAATDLLENLVAHIRNPEVPLLAPLAGTRAFMQVLEAVQAGPGAAGDTRGVPQDGPRDPSRECRCRASTTPSPERRDQLALLSELGLPWARPGAGAQWLTGHCGPCASAGSDRHLPGRQRARRDPLAAPLPPPGSHARRHAGDRRLAADHPWHLGISVALQDVDGWNFWGGPSYVGTGATCGARTTAASTTRPSAGRRQGLCRAAAMGHPAPGRLLLTEHRHHGSPSRPRVGSWSERRRRSIPTTGRYAWAAPRRTDGTARGTAASSGGFLPRMSRRCALSRGRRDAVHGSVAPWLVWTDLRRIHARVHADRRDSRADPWFVRIEDYPGVGLQLAAREPLSLPEWERGELAGCGCLSAMACCMSPPWSHGRRRRRGESGATLIPSPETCRQDDENPKDAQQQPASGRERRGRTWRPSPADGSRGEGRSVARHGVPGPQRQ